MNWLFLRGLTRELRHWGTFVPAFEKIVPDAKVHCLDLPGAGTEHEKSAPSSVEEMAVDVRKRWLTLKRANPGNWGILGVSLGGMIAMSWCGKHPKDFRRAVVLNSSSADLSSPLNRLRPRAALAFAKIAVERDALAKEKAIIAITHRLLANQHEIAETYHQIATSAPVSAANALKQLSAAALFRAPRELNLPLLFLASRKDDLAHYSCSEKLAKRYGSPLVIHPTAGHELAIDDPKWVSKRVREWLLESAVTS